MEVHLHRQMLIRLRGSLEARHSWLDVEQGCGAIINRPVLIALQELVQAGKFLQRRIQHDQALDPALKQLVSLVSKALREALPDATFGRKEDWGK